MKSFSYCEYKATVVGIYRNYLDVDVVKFFELSRGCGDTHLLEWERIGYS